MKILITGACGFVGTTLARALATAGRQLTIFGVDNFIRPGSEANRAELKRLGVRLTHGDIRNASDLETLPAVDFIIDAAANASVLAGVDGRTSSRQLVEHNLSGTINILEYCRTHGAGLILLSTSRVYAIEPLANMAVEVYNDAFRPKTSGPMPDGLSVDGVRESFSTAAPVSLYGATKLASEALSLEYGETFGFPVFINRCGVLAGGGQFGRPDQGIFSYWIHSYIRRRPLCYIGFNGMGYQVRDCLHPKDLLPLVFQQLSADRIPAEQRIVNCSGGAASARSLRQLTEWCRQRFGIHEVTSNPAPRQFDLPWVVLDSAKAANLWKWTPKTKAEDIFEEIASHAEANPSWLELSASF